MGRGMRKFQAETGKGKCQKGQTAHWGVRQLRILHGLFDLGFRGGSKFFQNPGSQKDTFPRQGKPKKEGRGHMVPVRAAIKHDDEDPEAGAFRKKLEEDYRDVLFKKVYAHEIDPEFRVEHGMATIRLKEGACRKRKGHLG